MNNYLFVSSRTTRDIAKKKGVIGFHDRTNTLNNTFANMEKGDRIFFYVTKEKIIDGYAILTKEMFLSEDKIYNNLDELCVRRIGVDVKESKKADFTKLISNLTFIKKKKGVVWSAYLVKNLIKLNEKDVSILEKAINA